MKCPKCGAQTEGRNANNRYIRCTHCNEILPMSMEDWQEAEDRRQAEAEAIAAKAEAERLGAEAKRLQEKAKAAKAAKAAKETK